MSQHLELVDALRRITQALDNHSKFLEARTGLTLSQVLVLEALASLALPTTAGALAARVSLSQGTLTTILDRLEGKGLVLRLRSVEDRRRVMVMLSEQGFRVAEQAPPTLPEHFQSAFERLGAETAESLLDSLRRIAQLMQRPDPADGMPPARPPVAQGA